MSNTFVRYPSSGGGGANTTLSNLTNPTSINQDLIFDSTGHIIKSDPTGNGDLQISAATTSLINGVGNTNILKFFDSTLTKYIGFQAPNSIGSPAIYVLPEDGTGGQVLSTNGSGTLSWIDAGGSGANTALSNLSSVAINLGLTFGASVVGALSTAAGTNSTALTLSTGDASAGNSGDLTLQTGTASGTRGSITADAQTVLITNAAGTPRLTVSSSTSVGVLEVNALQPILSLHSRNLNKTYQCTIDGSANLAFTDNDSGTTPFSIGSGSSTNTLALSNGRVDIGIGNAVTLHMNSNRIQEVTDPSSAQDAATKHYVDAIGNASAEANLGTLTWSAGVAPSGTISKTYRFSTNGKLVTVLAKITTTVAGTAVTSVSFPLPGGIPVPATWTTQESGGLIASGAGSIQTAVGSASAGSSGIYDDGSGGYKIQIFDLAALNATDAYCTVSYYSA